MPRRYRAGVETRHRILDALRPLLADAGLEGTTIKALCHRAEIRPGSFYNLFSSKEEAIVTVVREAIEAVDPDPAHEGRDTVKDLIEAYIRFIEDEPTLARIYLQMAAGAGANDDHLGGRLLRHHRNRLDRFADAMARQHPGWDPAEARRRAEFLLAALNGMTLARALDPTFDFAAYARDLLESRFATD